jgi:tripartite-type tricarboxylate transporter receptor subunit TctC
MPCNRVTGRVLRNAVRLAAMSTVILVSAATGAAETLPDNYPNKPIRFVTGFLPGGVSDTIARVTGDKLGEQLGQRVIIDGRPGAGGVLSMEIAASANPDGYTWYLAQPVITISPNFKRKLPLDPMKAFAPVSLIGVSPTVLVVHPSVPVSSVAELVAYAKARPDGLKVASSGPGTTNHLAGELFRVKTGIKLLNIAYKGAAATLLAAMSGEVEATFSPLVAGLTQVKAGKLKPVALTGKKRSPVLPNVPTIGETLPGYSVEAWYGLMVPARTPPAIVTFLNAQMRKALDTPAVKERLASQGVDVASSTPAEFAQFIRDDAAQWAKLVKDAGIQLE